MCNVYVCVLLCVECMLSSAHKTTNKSGVFFFSESSRSASQPPIDECTAAQQQRCNGSRAPSSRLCASFYGFCFFFALHIYLLSTHFLMISPSLDLTQTQTREAGSSPPSPATVRALVLICENTSALSSLVGSHRIARQ